VRQGKLEDFYLDVEPQPCERSYKEVLAEYQNHEVGGLAVTRANCQSPVDAWYLALQWVLHLDEESIREYRGINDLQFPGATTNQRRPL